MNAKPNNKKTFLMIAIMVVAVLVLAIILTNTMQEKPEVLSYDKVVNKVKEGSIEALYFEGDYVVNVLYKNGGSISAEEYATKVANFQKAPSLGSFNQIVGICTVLPSALTKFSRASTKLLR